ncbi:(2Fe-2S) ferredoxin domain-containing protein [Clostridium sp. CS001]|uniref:(2Fe-2S) ferredoxin domain-containing protein n=1 Tax=Clostridium sp. CS001 TaxID=2880648 RepID=UPI001CF50175|nr:(2Fe-2S) ferredoxin domain-containing protein [Clostridium sp. CS001]MCB2288663.1 (2Fe-2S) ferredoxin domain-containing protein [Clostridium sp. CS001]
MDILVCIGSSCHIRGSYKIMSELKAMIIEKKLDCHIQVKAAFCLGYCRDGVTIKVDEHLITGVTKENLTEVFDKYILKKVD